MAETLLNRIQLKIDEARAALADNAKERANEKFKSDIEAQIAKMTALMAELQGKGEEVMASSLQSVDEAITSLEELLKK